MSRSLIPNSTQTPDVIFDEWLPHLSGAETKVVLFIVRQTFGWGHTFKRLGTAQIVQGTGLERRAVQMACDSLEAIGAIGVRKANDGVTETAYRLETECHEKIIAALLARSAEAAGKHAAALAARSERQGGAKSAPGAKNAPAQKVPAGGAKSAPGGAQKVRPIRDKEETEEETIPHEDVRTSSSPTGGATARRERVSEPPSIEEAREFFTEKGKADLADEWWHYWDGVGWDMGRGKRMVKWRSAAASWMLRKANENGNRNGRNGNGAAPEGLAPSKWQPKAHLFPT